VPTFLAEQYVPGAARALIAAIAAAAQLAADAAPVQAGQVRYLATTLVPGDDLCYYLFEAPSVEAVRLVTEAGHLPCERIVEAHYAAAGPPETTTGG
jgi:hypothetical protein